MKVLFDVEKLEFEGMFSFFILKIRLKEIFRGLTHNYYLNISEYDPTVIANIDEKKF